MSELVVPPTPITKYRPPGAPGQLVGRERLLAQLEPGRRCRLTLILAPAGFGRTTLAVQWRGRLVAEGREVAWISVDQDDDNPVWFLAHLIESIRAVRPHLMPGRHWSADRMTADQVPAVLAATVAEIEAAGEPLVVVVDDWHRVHDPRVVAALDLLLTGPSGTIQWVITSRTRSGLPLAHLRAHHQLIEIDEVAMRFTAAELEYLLVDINGLTPAEGNVADVLRMTEGWVAALPLVALTLRPAAGPAGPVRELSGCSPSIDAYLTEGVLGGLPGEVLDFLIRTAGPERLCADLVAVLTGHGPSMLDRVADSGLFLRRLDDHPGWYRYHPLFAACLRRRLDREHPDEVGRLHRLAARWFADQPADPQRPESDVEAVGVSEREMEILQLLDFGRSNQEIASTLFLSPNTIKWHLKTLFQKFDVTRREECVVAARSAHLLY